MDRWHDRSGRIGQEHLEKTPIIAIVDDDSSIRLATESLVRSLGFVARTFASAYELLQSPDLYETACAIVDVQMPGMSGVDLQRVLSERGYQIPLIFITAFPEERIRDGVLKAGAVCFLSKPFDGRTMVDCLHTALHQHAGRASR
jgi:FixJ family two-component response regulator